MQFAGRIETTNNMQIKNYHTSTNNRMAITQIYANLFTSRQTKTFLFFVSFILALIAPIFFANGEIGKLIDVRFLLYLVIFPMGSVTLIVELLIPGLNVFNNPLNDLIIFILIDVLFWFICIAIMVNGIRSKSLKISKTLFFAFNSILLLNSVSLYFIFQ